MNRCATIIFYYSLITMKRSFWDQKKILVEKTDIDVALVMAFLVSEMEKTRKVYVLFIIFLNKKACFKRNLPLYYAF